MEIKEEKEFKKKNKKYLKDLLQHIAAKHNKLHKTHDRTGTEPM